MRAPQCVSCGDRLLSAQLLMGDGQCVNCREDPPEFERAVSFGEYRDGLRGLIRLLKYEGVTPAGRPLGRMLAHAISELLPSLGSAEGNLLLIPVPLHKGRRHARGFNQAEVIARSAIKAIARDLEFAPGLLIRQRETISQVGLSREERIENVRNAFCVGDPGRVSGHSVILVDDVMTTGTTLSECARVLKQAGAERVWAATVARAFHGVDLPQAAEDGTSQQAQNRRSSGAHEQEEVEAAIPASP